MGMIPGSYFWMLEKSRCLFPIFLGINFVYLEDASIVLGSTYIMFRFSLCEMNERLSSQSETTQQRMASPEQIFMRFFQPMVIIYLDLFFLQFVLSNKRKNELMISCIASDGNLADREF